MTYHRAFVGKFQFSNSCLCELPTGELGSVVRDKDIGDTVTAELQFHELDYGCGVGVLEWADFNKV